MEITDRTLSQLSKLAEARILRKSEADFAIKKIASIAIPNPDTDSDIRAVLEMFSLQLNPLAVPYANVGSHSWYFWFEDFKKSAVKENSNLSTQVIESYVAAQPEQGQIYSAFKDWFNPGDFGKIFASSIQNDVSFVSSRQKNTNSVSKPEIASISASPKGNQQFLLKSKAAFSSLNVKFLEEEKIEDLVSRCAYLLAEEVICDAYSSSIDAPIDKVRRAARLAIEYCMLADADLGIDWKQTATRALEDFLYDVVDQIDPATVILNCMSSGIIFQDELSQWLSFPNAETWRTLVTSVTS
jgi:hypothetical protein